MKLPSLFFLGICLCVFSCTKNTQPPDNVWIESSDSLIFMHVKIESSIFDSVQVLLDKNTGDIVRVIKYHNRDTIQRSLFNKKGALEMWEAFSFTSGKPGGRIYYDTTLRRTMEGPIERINGPFSKIKVIYFKDGKSFRYIHYMTEGVIDSIFYFDSLPNNVKGVRYEPATLEKLKQMGRLPELPPQNSK